MPSSEPFDIFVDTTNVTTDEGDEPHETNPDGDTSILPALPLIPCPSCGKDKDRSEFFRGATRLSVPLADIGNIIPTAPLKRKPRGYCIDCAERKMKSNKNARQVARKISDEAKILAYDTHSWIQVVNMIAEGYASKCKS